MTSSINLFVGMSRTIINYKIALYSSSSQQRAFFSHWHTIRIITEKDRKCIN